MRFRIKMNAECKECVWKLSVFWIEEALKLLYAPIDTMFDAMFVLYFNRLMTILFFSQKNSRLFLKFLWYFVNSYTEYRSISFHYKNR